MDSISKCPDLSIKYISSLVLQPCIKPYIYINKYWYYYEFSKLECHFGIISHVLFLHDSLNILLFLLYDLIHFLICSILESAFDSYLFSRFSRASMIFMLCLLCRVCLIFIVSRFSMLLFKISSFILFTVISIFIAWLLASSFQRPFFFFTLMVSIILFAL